MPYYRPIDDGYEAFKAQLAAQKAAEAQAARDAAQAVLEIREATATTLTGLDGKKVRVLGGFSADQEDPTPALNNDNIRSLRSRLCGPGRYCRFTDNMVLGQTLCIIGDFHHVLVKDYGGRGAIAIKAHFSRITYR